MKKIAVAGIAAGIVGVALAADYTPVTRESGTGPNAYGAVTLTASSSTTVTNGQVLSLSAYPVLLVDASGQGSVTTTNTIAAAAAARVGQMVTIINVGASNGVLIADSAPVYGTGPTVGPNDAVTYFVKATNVIVEVSKSDN